jgi:hypothetical protein
MPALLAYLIALGLLFGAGYGALNWLAEPPVKMAAKANSKSKSQPSYQQAPSSYQAPSQQVTEASPPASKSDQNSVTPTANDHDAASASKDQKIPSRAQPSPATDGPAMQPAVASPAAAGNEIRSANAEVPSDDGRRKAEPSVKPSVAADPPRSQPSSAASAPGAIDRPSRRPHSRQAGSHVEKRSLEVMTLRTIEFPDGRRITQLIPLGGGESLPR